MPRKKKNPIAVAFGRLGGLAKSEAKARAVRENGRKGGHWKHKDVIAAMKRQKAR